MFWRFQTIKLDWWFNWISTALVWVLSKCLSKRRSDLHGNHYSVALEMFCMKGFVFFSFFSREVKCINIKRGVLQDDFEWRESTATGNPNKIKEKPSFWVILYKPPKFTLINFIKTVCSLTWRFNTYRCSVWCYEKSHPSSADVLAQG